MIYSEVIHQVKQTIILITVFIFHCVLTQCSPQNNIGNIRIALSGNPPTLDWNLATDSLSYQVITQIMEGLTQYDENLNVIPAVAASWNVLDNGKKYIFHIDPQYKWSDGLPVNALHFRDS
ncbi:MAG: hypothetical protein ACD_73C00821G0001, partial [uncultured bacterium]